MIISIIGDNVDCLQLNKVYLKYNPDFNEGMIQEHIARNPEVLDLGDLKLICKEKFQPNGGRLDLLFEDSSNQRYEVEVQLGNIDESHMIRTIEYWDFERRKYQTYNHYPVIVAENITSRFLNVIQFFCESIPIVAVQMNAYEIEGKIGLSFAKIIDNRGLGTYHEYESIESADRSFWETRSSKQTVELVDKLLDIITEIDPFYKIKYNKPYIGLTKNETPNNFISFVPRKHSLMLVIKLDQSEEIEEELNKPDLEFVGYDVKKHSYKISLDEKGVENEKELLRKLFKISYDQEN